MSNNVRYPNAFQAVQDPRSQIIQQSMLRNQGSTLNQMLKETQVLGQENQQQAARIPQQQSQIQAQTQQNSIHHQIQQNQQLQTQSSLGQQSQANQQAQQQRNTADRIRLSMQSPRLYSIQNNSSNNQQQQNQQNLNMSSNGITQIQNQNVNSSNLGVSTTFSNKKTTPIANTSPHSQIQNIRNNMIEEKDLNRQQSIGNNSQQSYTTSTNTTQKPLFESQILSGTQNNQKIAGQRKSSLFVPPTSQQQQNVNYFNSVSTQPAANLNNQSTFSQSALQMNQDGQISQLQKQRSFHQLPANGNASSQVQMLANANNGVLPLQNMTNVITNNQGLNIQQQQGIQMQQQQQQQQPFLIQVEDGNQAYIVQQQPNQNIFISPNGPTQSLRQSQVFPNLKQQQQQIQQQQIGHQQNPINQSQILSPMQIQQQVNNNAQIQLLNSPSKPCETELSSIESDLQQQQFYLAQQLQLQQQYQQQQPAYIVQQNSQSLQNTIYTPQPIPSVGSPTNSASNKSKKYQNQQIHNQPQYPQSMSTSQINMNQPNTNTGNTGSSRLKQLYNSPQQSGYQQVNQSSNNVLHNSRYLLQQQQNQSAQPALVQQSGISQITLLNDQSSQWSTQNLPNTQLIQDKHSSSVQVVNEQIESENRQLKNRITQYEEQQKETQLQYISQQSYLSDLEKKIKMLIQQNEKLQSVNDNSSSQEKIEVVINQIKGERDQLQEEIVMLKQSQHTQNQQNEEQIKVLVSNLESKMHELVIENERINAILSNKYQEIEQFQKMQESFTQLQRQNNIFNHLINEGQNEYKLKIQNLETENGELKLTVKELRSRIKQNEAMPDLELVVKDFEQKINQLVEENNRLNQIIEDLEQREIKKVKGDEIAEQKKQLEKDIQIQDLTTSNKDYKEQIEYWKKKCVELERKKLNESSSQKDSNPSSLQNSASKQSNSASNQQKSEVVINDKAFTVQNTRIIDLETKLNYVLQENEKLNNILTEQITITQSLAKNSSSLKQKQQKQVQTSNSSNNLNTATSTTSTNNNNENTSEK